MLIGELAHRTGVSAKTLRFYERRGLLDEPARTQAGYRSYSEGAVDRLRFIRSAQSAGLTLAEIGEIITIRDRGRPPCDHVVDLLERRAGEVEAQIAELQRLQGEIATLRRRSGHVDRATCSPDTVCDVLLPG